MNNIKNRIDKATTALKILTQVEKELKLAKKDETELRKKALIKLAIKAKDFIYKQKALKIKGGDYEDDIKQIQHFELSIKNLEKEIELIQKEIKVKNDRLFDLQTTKHLMEKTDKTDEINDFILKLITIEAKLNNEINELNISQNINIKMKKRLISDMNNLYRNLQEPDIK
jgi:hypothetical protein